MVGRTKRPTAKEAERMGTLKSHMPCIACLMTHGKIKLPEVHHITDCGRRIGHNATIPLCGWHHQGHVGAGFLLNRQACRGKFGPSLAHGKKEFNQVYGGEKTLLEITNWLLEQYKKQDWMYYNVPRSLIVEAQEKWIEKLKNR